MKDLYKFFYLKKGSRTSVCNTFSLHQKTFSKKNIENVGKKKISCPHFKSNYKNRKEKNFLKSQPHFPFWSCFFCFDFCFCVFQPSVCVTATKDENSKERKVSLKKNSFLLQKILHFQINQFIELFSLYCLKHLKGSFEKIKFSSNCLFFESFSHFFDQNNRKFKKLHTCKIQKTFLEKKRKIAKFFYFFFLNVNKRVSKKNKEKRDVVKGSNKNLCSSFLFWNQQTSRTEIKKQKFLFLHFYLELQFSSFSVFKNFSLISFKKKSQTRPFFSIQEKKAQDHQKNSFVCKKMLQPRFFVLREKRIKLFLYQTFFKVNFLLLSCKKTSKTSFQNIFIFNKRRKYKQKKYFFLLEKKTVCKKIFILFFSTFNTFVDKCSFFHSLPTVSSFLDKNEKRKEKLKFERKIPLEKLYFLKNKGNLTKFYVKNLFLNSLNISKKILQIFVDSFLNLNFLKTQNDSFDNLNTFFMIFHQYLKLNLFAFHGTIQKKKKIFLKNFCSFSLFHENFFFVLKKDFSPFFGIDKIQSISLQKYSFGKKSQYFLQKKQTKKEGFTQKFLSLSSLMNLFHFEKSIFHLLTFFFMSKKPCFSFLFEEQNVFSGHVVQQKLKLSSKKQLWRKLKQKVTEVPEKQKQMMVIRVYKQNIFYFSKKFLKNFSLNPIFFILKHFLSRFLFFKNKILLFLKNKNCIKWVGTLFEKSLNLKKHFFSKIHIKNNLSFQNKNFSWFYFPFELWPLFQKQKRIKYLLYQKLSWIFSKNFKVLPTKAGSLSIFQICPFFSSFFGMNSINFLKKEQKKFLEFLSQKRILSIANFESFSFSFGVQYKKGLQNFFFLSKKPTYKSIKLHLEFCKAILKKAKGQNPFSFMQKLHKKIYNWCQKYKSINTKEIFYYCDSILLKYLWNWAQRKHPKKSKLWIRNKYFHFLHSNQWFFGEKRGKKFFCLPLHSQTKIHVFD